MSASTKVSIKTQKGEQTKALILNAALEVFHEHGYDETTMRASRIEEILMQVKREDDEKKPPTEE